MDRVENICSDPNILAKEVEHLNRVLQLQQLPTMVDQQVGKV